MYATVADSVEIPPLILFPRVSTHASSAAPIPTSAREFRDVQVKVHIRRPERDSWAYLGRALVSQEMTGQSSRVGTIPCPHAHPCIVLTYIPPVVRSMSSGKVMVSFGEVRDNPILALSLSLASFVPSPYRARAFSCRTCKQRSAAISSSSVVSKALASYRGR